MLLQKFKHPFVPLSDPLFKMEFLRKQHIVSLADPGRSTTFIADIFETRPPFDEIAQFQAWAAEAGEQMREVKKRKNCAVAWMQLVVDHFGLVAILRFTHPVIVGQAKTAAVAILKCLPKEQRLAVEQGLRPFDEVDRNRILAWQTVESLRPRGQKRKCPPEQDKSEEVCLDIEEYIPTAKHAKKAESILTELLAEESDDSDSEGGLAVPRLMLTDDSSAERVEESQDAGTIKSQAQTLAVPSILDPAAVWEYRAKCEAVIVVAEVGERPEQLTYIRCHRETRRQLLLQSKIKDEYERPCMKDVVRVAMQLAKDGCMPGPGEHGRKSEFIKRCATALQALDPSKETDLTKLSAEDQALIRQALGGDTSTPYNGCLNEGCLDKDTIWVTSNIALPGDPFMQMSRCAHCKCPKAFGRSVSSIRDILQLQRVGRVAPFLNNAWEEF